MRYPLCLIPIVLAAPSASAQAGAASAAVQVTLVARKLGSVGVQPSSVDAERPVDVGAARRDAWVGVTTAWNLSPAQVGDVRLRTTRSASRAGAAYIERRVLLLDPVARVRHALDVAPLAAASVDSLIVVRLVVY